MSDLVLTKCPPRLRDVDERCYVRPEDYDTFFGVPAHNMADACPASLGEENCKVILLNKKKREEDTSQTGGALWGGGIGFARAQIIRKTDVGEAQDAWNGFGVNGSVTGEPFVWGLANLSLSGSADLLFDDGVATVAGMGPTLSFGIPALARVWGGLRATGIAGQHDDEGFGGAALGSEIGVSLFMFDFRYRLPSFASTEGARLDNGVAFFGLSIGLP